MNQNKKSIIMISVVVLIAIVSLIVGVFLLKHNKGNTAQEVVAELSTKEVNIEVGKYALLELDEVIEGQITWESSDESVAVVNDGVLTGINGGVAVVTAKDNSRVIGTFKITVFPAGTHPIIPNEILPESVVLNKDLIVLGIGEKEVLSASVLPDDASDKTIIWTSNDTAVATVSDGEVVGVAEGYATISAISSNGMVATCTVVVGNGIASSGEYTLKLNSTEEYVSVGGKATIIYNVTPDDGTPVTWSSADSSIATISNGEVTGRKVGNTTITATWHGLKISVKIHVVSDAIPVNKITLTPSTKTISVGESYLMNVKVEPSNATNKDIEWSSSDPSIVKVSDGNITGVKVGKAKITATIGKKKAEATITVEKVVPSFVQLNKSYVELKVGANSTVIANVLPRNADDKRVKWTSDNPNVATVKVGVIQGVAPGETTVRATTYNNKVGTVKVKVVSIPVSSVTLNKSSETITYGNTLQLTATVAPSNATYKNVTWSSSDNSVVTVSNTGLVTAKGPGTATITATADGKSATFKATVVVFANSVAIQLNGKTVTDVETKLGTDIKFTAVISPANTTNKNITWSSSNENVGTIKDGQFTIKRTGSTDIIARTSNGKEAKVKVIVKGSRVHFIKLNSIGDATLLESNGHFALIDTGDVPDAATVEKYLNSLGVNVLDFLVLSHRHMENSGNAVYLADKFKINHLYLKKYNFSDEYVTLSQSEQEIIKKAYNDILQKYRGDYTFVDNANSFAESSSGSTFIYLGAMKVYFFNTKARTLAKPSGVQNEYNGYYNESYFYGQSENINSIVNLVSVDGKYVLLNADLTKQEILGDIFKERIKNRISKIEIYKYPHHANYDCIGRARYVSPLNYSVTASVGYYVVTNKIDTKFANGTYKITENKVYWNESVANNPYASCMYNFTKGDATRAKAMMCNAYYTMNANDAVVFDLTNTMTTVSGGGQGKSVSNRCR